jgi:hypothetical protein
MAKRFILWCLVTGILVVLVAALLYQPVIKPWHLRWGATDAEVQLALPGDELVTGTVDQSTRAIDIHTPAAQVWPWLVQMGQGRGGLYSYDFLENLVGCNIHTLARVDPTLQDLKVGDTIKIGPQTGLPHYIVMLIEPEKALVLRSVNATTGEPGETWGFYLSQSAENLTRLVIRHRSNPSLDSTERIVNGVFEPITFVMEHRMLYGIRDHAEKRMGAAALAN